MKLLQSMSMRQRLVLGGSVVAVLVIAFMLLKLASAPSYSLIATGLDPAKTGKMTAALDAQGVPYELRNNGTALAVEKNSTAQAQIALADAGLSTSGSDSKDGLSAVTDLKMGASTFQQKIAYQQGLEQTIESTLGNVEGVSGAQVQLTLPEDQLFADEAKPATAAVLLSGESGTLDAGAIKGMANLVANSVEGLKPANVTITDATGTMLWPAEDGAVSGAMSKQAAEARFDAQMEAQLNALVVRTLGPGKGLVEVNADLNVDKTSVEQLQYDKKGTPTETTKETEKLKGSGGSGGTAAGTTSNVPGYAQNGGGGSGGNSNYQNTKTSQTMAVGKTVKRTEVAPGSVDRLDVAVAVDKSVPAADVRALQTTIASAAGIQTNRGDTLAVSQMAFAKQPAATPAASGPLPSGGMFGYAKYALLGLAALLFLFFISRHLRRRENEVLADPAWLRQLEAPTPIAQLEDLSAPPASLIVQTNPRKKQIEEVVTKEPERVAVALRTWMNEP